MSESLKGFRGQSSTVGFLRSRKDGRVVDSGL